MIQCFFPQDPKTLQSILNDIENYCISCGLKLNTNKTQIIIFERGRPTQYDFYLYNKRIEIVESFEYLGIQLYKNGNWNRTQKHIAQHALFSLQNLFVIMNQTDLFTSQKMQFYNILIKPVLNYGSEIWGYHKATEVESILSKCCRKLLCVKRSTNLDAMYGELGCLPMYIRRQLSMTKYWLKILQSHENSLLFKTYKMLKL